VLIRIHSRLNKPLWTSRRKKWWVGWDQPAETNPWLDYARMILVRDFDREPMDRSTIKTYRIGLKGNDHPDAKAAVEKLKSVKPARWTKRDLKAGRLLPRKPV